MSPLKKPNFINAYWNSQWFWTGFVIKINVDNWISSAFTHRFYPQIYINNNETQQKQSPVQWFNTKLQNKMRWIQPFTHNYYYNQLRRHIMLKSTQFGIRLHTNAVTIIIFRKRTETEFHFWLNFTQTQSSNLSELSLHTKLI